MIRLICVKLPQVRPRASSLSYGHLFTTSSHMTNADLSTCTDSQACILSSPKTASGLSSESAISVSKKLHFDKIDNPASVLNLLKTHGLPQSVVENLIRNRPRLLYADLEKTLKPNLELFTTLGISSTVLAKILKKKPKILEINAITVVEFFRANGFSDKQIATLTMKFPAVYLSNAERTVKPKLESLKSLGFSGSEITNILSIEPYILESSLENQIMPCIKVLRDILGNDEDVRKAIKACYRVLRFKLEKVLAPNVLMLVSHGVPKSRILKLIVLQPRSFLLGTNHFSEIVTEVVKLGFDPNSLAFVLAIRSMAVMSRTRWEQKLEVYRSFGFLKDEIYSAFKLQPMFMIPSENKIRKMMNFFINKLNVKPSIICKYPNLLLLSLEKRIIPRCSVLQLLFSAKLIKGNTRLFHIFVMTEKNFMEKFVSKYQDLVPGVVKAFQGKIEFKGFPIVITI